MGESSRSTQFPIPRFVFVVGPTATGKSALALEWAKSHRANIINCDSIQAYERLQIGAAKPTTQEMREAPHHLYGYASLQKPQTAGDYRRKFYDFVQTRSDVSRAVVVGGTGFYFQAIEHGMYPTLAQFPEIRRRVDEELRLGKALELYEKLEKIDPEVALKISPNDHYRLGRALEIIEGEGKSITEIKAEFASRMQSFAYPLLKIGVHLDRESLRERVQARVAQMLQSGLINEVRVLVEEGYADSHALKSIGYREVMTYLRETKSVEWLHSEITKNTMALAKKQMTWFKRDPGVHWISADSRSDKIRASELVAGFFQGSS